MAKSTAKTHAARPDYSDPHYFAKSAGYSTLDDLVAVLEERGSKKATDIRKAIDVYGPDELWNSIVGPMLDRIETEVLDMTRP